MVEKYKLYNGRIILSFDKDRHIYSVGKKKVYGVTSIVGVIDKSGPLKYWAVNMAIEVLQKKLIPGQSLDELEIQYLLEEAKKAHTKRLKKAGDIGTMTHQFLTDYITAGVNKKPLPKLPVNKEIRNCLKGFFNWVKANKVKFISSEQKVYSVKHNFAGCYDAEAMVNGKLTLIDFKTSKALYYPEMFLQAAAYAVSREEEMKKRFTGGVMLLRLSKENKEKKIDSFEARTIPRKELTNGLFEVFLACKKIYECQMEYKKKELQKKYGK